MHMRVSPCQKSIAKQKASISQYQGAHPSALGVYLSCGPVSDTLNRISCQSCRRLG